MSVLIRPARQKQVFCTTVDRNGGWQSQLILSSVIATKPNGAAGIQLDGNGATGDFTLSLSPANLTAARRWSFPDRSDTVAGLGAQTFTGAQTVGTVQVSGVSGAGFKITAVSGYGFVALNNDTTFTGTCGFMGGASGDSALYLFAPTGFPIDSRVNNVTCLRVAGALATSFVPLLVSDTTDATSTTAAALVVSGGVAWGATKTAYGGGLRLVSPAIGLGYATGAGGTVTQATSKSTGVTINKVCGTITTNNASLAAASSVVFTVTNSTVVTTDVPIVAISSGAAGGNYQVTVDNVGSGSFNIHVRNVSAGSLSDALVLNFFVNKSVSS